MRLLGTRARDGRECIGRNGPIAGQPIAHIYEHKPLGSQPAHRPIVAENFCVTELRQYSLDCIAR